MPKVLVVCIITSLVSAHEFEEPLGAQFNRSLEADDQFYMDNSNSNKNTNETLRGELYDQDDDTSATDPEIRGYSKTDKLPGNTKQGFTTASQMSLAINVKNGDNETDDAMLNNEPRTTDKEVGGIEELHGPGTIKLEPAENVSLTSHPTVGSSEVERMVLTNKSDNSIYTEWSKEVMSTESIARGDTSEDQSTRDSSTVTSIFTLGIAIDGKSTPTYESSTPNGYDTSETTDLGNTSVSSEIPVDDDNFMKKIEAAAFKLYVGAAVVFVVILLVTVVVALTLWTRRRRALRKERILKRMSQRSQVPQLEKLFSMAAFAAATDGADPSRTLTRTATVGRRPQGPRPIATAASLPLLQNSNTEDLAQIRKEMFGDVRTWAPERRISNPPSRNFFK